MIIYFDIWAGKSLIQNYNNQSRTAKATLTAESKQRLIGGGSSLRQRWAVHGIIDTERGLPAERNAPLQIWVSVSNTTQGDRQNIGNTCMQATGPGLTPHKVHTP